MPSRNSSTRSLLFRVLVWLNLPLSLLAGVILYLQMGGTIEWLPNIIEDFFGVNFEKPAPPIALFAVVLFVCILAYFISFHFRAKRRPRTLVILLHAQIAFIIAMGIMGVFDLSLGVLSILLLLLIVGAIPAGLWGMERLVARAASTLGKSLLAKEKHHPGMEVVHFAILLNPEDIHLRKLLGAARFETGDIPGTIAVLEPLVQQSPDDLPMLEALEECYRTERMWDKVLAICRQRLEQEPQSHALRVRTARVLEKMERYAEAIELLYAGFPTNNLDYLEQMLGYFLHLKNLEGALAIIDLMQKIERLPRPRCLDAFRSLLEIDPSHLPALEKLANLLIESGVPEEGFQILERIVQFNSVRHDLRKRLVQYYQDNGLLDRAEPHLVALMDAGQETADVALLYGDILVQREEYDRALSHLQFVVERYPGDFRFAFFLAQVSFRTQALEEAIRWLDTAAEMEVSAEDRARLQGLRKRVEKALVDRDLRILQERCDRDPNNIELRLNYIEAMVRHGMAEKAVVEYDGLLEEQPELKDRVLKQLEAHAAAPEPNFRLMDYLLDLKAKDQRWDEVFQIARQLAARSMLGERLLADQARRILKSKPDHLPSVLCLAEKFEKEERWQEAVDVFEAYQALAPDDSVPEIRRGLFLAHAGLANTEKSIETGESFLQDYPHDVDLRLRLVHVYLEERRFEDAYLHLQRAQSTDYYNQEVTRLLREVAQQRRLQQLEELQGRIDNNPGDTQALLDTGELYVALGESKKAIPFFQRASQDANLKNVALARLGNAMARLRMFDLAEETLDEAKLRADQPEEQNAVKVLFFDSAEIFEAEEEVARALKLYKRIFRVDAAFRNVVDKIEALGG